MPERAGHVHKVLCVLGGCFDVPSLTTPTLVLYPGAQEPSCWLLWMYLQMQDMSMCQCWGSSVQAGDPFLILLVCDHTPAQVCRTISCS